MKLPVSDWRDQLLMLSVDTMLMLRDLKDFIDFSEENIRWQQKRELYRAEQECDAKLIDDPSLRPDYRESKREEVQRRFDSLLQRVRYGSLIALVTTVERVAMTLQGIVESFDRSIPPRPPRKNKAVHVLEVFNQIGEHGFAQQILDLETLTQVRNCIVHAAGLVDEFDNGALLRLRLTEFNGIKISAHDFWGQDTIEIEDGYLQRVHEDMQAWLLKLW